jgi:hypothetical protein
MYVHTYIQTNSTDADQTVSHSDAIVIRINNRDTQCPLKDIHYPFYLILYTTPVGGPGKEAGTAAGKDNNIAAVKLQKIRRTPDFTEIQDTPTTNRKLAA